MTNPAAARATPAPHPSDTPGAIATRRADLYAEVWGHRRQPATPTTPRQHDQGETDHRTQGA